TFCAPGLIHAVIYHRLTGYGDGASLAGSALPGPEDARETPSRGVRALSNSQPHLLPNRTSRDLTGGIRERVAHDAVARHEDGPAVLATGRDARHAGGDEGLAGGDQLVPGGGHRDTLRGEQVLVEVEPAEADAAE